MPNWIPSDREKAEWKRSIEIQIQQYCQQLYAFLYTARLRGGFFMPKFHRRFTARAHTCGNFHKR